MSGGYWDYKNDTLACEMFEWMSPDYGERGFSRSTTAARINPLEDRELSELVWDVFCLLHSYDWYASSDIGEAGYRADVDRFKNKWLRKSKKDRVQRQIDMAFEDMKAEFYKMFGIEEVSP